MTSDRLEQLCKERDDAMAEVRAAWFDAELLAHHVPNGPWECPHWKKYLAVCARLDAELIRKKPNVKG